MRASSTLLVLVSASILSLACSSTTDPEPTPSEQPDLVLLTVAPSHAAINAGHVVTLTAQISNASSYVPQSAIRWFSSDTTVATVRPGGIVEGRKTGRIQIVATWGRSRGSATVEVLNEAAKKPVLPLPQCLKRLPRMASSAIPSC